MITQKKDSENREWKVKYKSGRVGVFIVVGIVPRGIVYDYASNHVNEISNYGHKWLKEWGELWQYEKIQ